MYKNILNKIIETNDNENMKSIGEIIGLKVKDSKLHQGNLKIEFLGLGGIYHPEIKAEGYYSSAYTSGNYGFCIENISSKYQTINIEGLSINGAYIPCNKKIKIPPGCKTYISSYIGEYDLLPYKITSIAELSVALSTSDDNLIGNTKPLWIPIKLDTFGAPISGEEITTPVIYDKNGVKVAVDSYVVDKWGSSIYTLMIVNTSESDVSLNVLNEDGTPVKSSVSNVRLGPKQYRKVKIEFYWILIDGF